MADITEIQLTYSSAMKQADRLYEVADTLRQQAKQLQSVVETLAHGGWTGEASTDYCHRILDKAEQITVCAFNAEVYAEGIEETARLIKREFDAKPDQS